MPDPKQFAASRNWPTAKVAVVQAEAEECQSSEAFIQKIDALAQQARDLQADIAVFPEDICLWMEFSPVTERVKQLEFAIKALKIASAAGSLVHKAETFVLGHEPPAPPANPERTPFTQFREDLAKWIERPVLADLLQDSDFDLTYQLAFTRAAKKYGLVIVGGSLYQKREDGTVTNSCYVFDSDGTVRGRYDKHHLVGLETQFGVVESRAPIRPISTKRYDLGVCICYDLNFGANEAAPYNQGPFVAAELAAGGAQIICAGSTGHRPGPNGPYDPAIDCPQIERAKEVDRSIVRVYQQGWLIEKQLYMDGLSEIIMPDGSTLWSAYPDYRNDQLVVVQDVPIAPRERVLLRNASKTNNTVSRRPTRTSR